ncbi:hypothetical protein OTU49_015661, partial [Cherax quadricarinatus]
AGVIRTYTTSAPLVPALHFLMAALGRTINFSNGKSVPVLGLGTWESKPGDMTAAVKNAVTAGYRHIDCAHLYGNEPEVGAAIAALIKDGTVTRDELFITSKLWNTFHAKSSVLPALKTTLADLGLDYIDLYLIHWPMGYKEGGDLLPADSTGKKLYSDVDYVETWEAMEECVKLGLTRSIGVSNFNKKQLERVLKVAKVPIANNQIEVHPYLPQNKLIEFCKSKGITITAYSPLGSPERPWAKPGDPVLTEDPKVKTLAQKYKKSPAQILIRFQIDRGLIVIPKSANKSRIEENFQIWDFQLSPEDIKLLESLECNGRICSSSEASDHPYFPFHDEY